MSDNKKRDSNFSVSSDADWNSNQARLKCDKAVSKHLEKNGINKVFLSLKTHFFRNDKAFLKNREDQQEEQEAKAVFSDNEFECAECEAGRFLFLDKD